MSPHAEENQHPHRRRGVAAGTSSRTSTANGAEWWSYFIFTRKRPAHPSDAANIRKKRIDIRRRRPAASSCHTRRSTLDRESFVLDKIFIDNTTIESLASAQNDLRALYVC
jgi:hypothetical protein